MFTLLWKLHDLIIDYEISMRNIFFLNDGPVVASSETIVLWLIDREIDVLFYVE